MAAKDEQCSSVIGLIGRDYDDRNPAYIPGDTGPGFHNIAIGRAMLLDWGLCRAFTQLRPMMDDLAFKADTPWGAEDIFASLLARHLTGQLPYIVPTVWGEDVLSLDAGPMEGPDAVAISATQFHIPFRDDFLRQAIRNLRCIGGGLGGM